MPTPSKNVLEASACYKTASSLAVFTRIQGYSSVRSANSALARLRKTYPELFPLRNFRRVGKVDPVKVSEALSISKTLAEAAGICGYETIASFKMAVSRFRSEYGEELFPRKNKVSKVNYAKHITPAMIKSASILWRTGAPTQAIAQCLKLSNADTAKFIESYRARHGLNAFPYRGLVIKK